MEILFGTEYVMDPATEAENLARQRHPLPPAFARANSFWSPVGEEPGRGWFLLLRKSLELLDRNGLHTVRMADDSKRSINLYSLSIAAEPQCLTPGDPGDSNACYLVEVQDARGRVQNPRFHHGLTSRQYNVRAPGWDTDYYIDSTNGGSAWTWTGIVGDLWSELATLLGTYPGLPFTPDGTPGPFRFVGVSAWKALCEVLWRIGCAVVLDPTVSSNPCSIVRVGGSDGVTETALGLLLDSVDGLNRRLYDYEALEVTRRIPANVRVLFHRRNQHYGTEQTTQKTDVQPTTNPVHAVDVATGVTGAEVGVYHPLWDDLQAIYDVDGNLLNAAELSARALERTTDFVQQQQDGGGRRHYVFSGVVANIKPGATIKGVSWRMDPLRGGLVTEIVRHPYRMLQVMPEQGFCACDPPSASSALQPPHLAPEEPVYPHLLQLVRCATSSADGSGRFDAYVQKGNPTTLTVSDAERVWLWDPGSTTSFQSGGYYLARLGGYTAARPWYQAIGRPPGSTSAPCAVNTWFDATVCLTATIEVGGVGLCAAVAGGQWVVLASSDGITWESVAVLTTDTGDWTVLYDWPDGGCCPRVRLASTSSAGPTVALRYMGCWDGVMKFSGSGTDLCNGVSAGGCADNTFVVDIECSSEGVWWCVDDNGTIECQESCLEPSGAGITVLSGPHATQAECEAECCADQPNPNYGGAGWYCMCDGTIQYLAADPFNCDADCIDSGPYATEAEAEVACDAIPPDCVCASLPDTLTATVVGCAGMPGTVTLTRSSPTTWIGNNHSGINFIFLTLICNGPNCEDFTLTASGYCGPPGAENFGTVNAATGCSCGPLHMVFSGFTAPGPNCCSGSSIPITVDE